ELQSATEKRNECIATLAHEIRNPLAPISNALSLMQGGRPEDPAQVEMRDVIGCHGKRAMRRALAPISDALSLMQRVRQEDPAQVEMRDVIGRQAKRLTRIADDML